MPCQNDAVSCGVYAAQMATLFRLDTDSFLEVVRDDSLRFKLTEGVNGMRK